MNNYFKNLEKIEFVITYACTGKCIHCSEGEHSLCGDFLSPDAVTDIVNQACALFDIKTVMTFGGEPLLYPESVFAAHKTALLNSVPHRQLITNGFFTKDVSKMRDTAKHLADCGVNDLLLSVDAFHQKNIPLDTVKRFALEALSAGVPIRTQPAWLVSRDDKNPYNAETARLLSGFEALGIKSGEGNVIFAQGNAVKYLSEFFVNSDVKDPYAEDPYDMHCLSFDPDGTLFGKSVRDTALADIIEQYVP